MRVIVVDDDQLVEMSLTTILGSDEEIEEWAAVMMARKLLRCIRKKNRMLS